MLLSVRLVWANATTYNRPDSNIYIVADKLKRQFERKFSKIKKEAASSTSTQDKAAAQDQAAFKQAMAHEKKIDEDREARRFKFGFVSFWNFLIICNCGLSLW